MGALEPSLANNPFPVKSQPEGSLPSQSEHGGRQEGLPFKCSSRRYSWPITLADSVFTLPAVTIAVGAAQTRWWWCLRRSGGGAVLDEKKTRMVGVG